MRSKNILVILVVILTDLFKFKAETDNKHPRLSAEEINRIMSMVIDDHKCEHENYEWTPWRSENTPADNTYDMELLIHHQKFFG